MKIIEKSGLEWATLGVVMHTCPVCNSNFPNFLPIPERYVRFMNDLGVSYSLDEFETLNLGQYLCPHCEATDRDRLYALFVQVGLNRKSGDTLRILDIAPNKSLSRYLRGLSDVRYRSGDINSVLADEQVDICNMPQFPNSSFDLIVCSHVLEHVTDDRMAMREMLRILSPVGRAILMVPILTTAIGTDEDPNEARPEERWRRFAQDDHVRLYERNDWLARLRAEMWCIRELGSADFGADQFKKHGIHEDSILYVGSHN